MKNRTVAVYGLLCGNKGKYFVTYGRLPSPTSPKQKGEKIFMFFSIGRENLKVFVTKVSISWHVFTNTSWFYLCFWTTSST